MACSWASDEAMLVLSSSSADGDSAGMDSSGSNYNDVALLPDIWSSLPQEIIESILERVPFSSLTGFRMVSKRWNSLILTSSFSVSCRRPDATKCVPLLAPYGFVDSWRWAMHPFNSDRNSWEVHPLPFLGGAANGEQIVLSACSGGLMCFKTKDRKNFIVCNPVTKQWRHLALPDPECIRDTGTNRAQDVDHLESLTGLVVNLETGCYTLMVASLAAGAELHTMLYDSSTGVWSRGAPVPSGKRFVNHGAVTFNGNMYSLLKDPRDVGQRYGVWRVVKYSVQANKWSEVAAETRWHGLTPSKFELILRSEFLMLATRELDNRWLPNNVFFKTWYHTFYKVMESSNGQQFTLVKERRVPSGLKRSTGKIELHIPVARYPCGLAGHGDYIYAMRIPQSKPDEIHVQKVRANTSCDDIEHLPSLCRTDQTCMLEMKTFEASRTAIP